MGVNDMLDSAAGKAHKNQGSQTRHLRAEPRRLLGDALKTTIELLGSFDISSVDELKREKPLGRASVSKLRMHAADLISLALRGPSRKLQAVEYVEAIQQAGSDDK
ncbi:hypothetical protein VE02_10007 [Pseudogymnoascus sp. 03VT05]|nr:hypothetical protein VE02_10007 [Pseudogymnoascus sp. 03VT05]